MTTASSRMDVKMAARLPLYRVLRPARPLLVLLAQMVDAARNLLERLAMPRARTVAAVLLTDIAVVPTATVWWLMGVRTVARTRLQPLWLQLLQLLLSRLPLPLRPLRHLVSQS
jgi:hypothetical protein